LKDEKHYEISTINASSGSLDYGRTLELKWLAPSPKEAITPGIPLKWSSISFAATLENLQINTCTTEYTSIKKVHTTLVFLFF
jgi:hypothetical protein